jgi:mono/diheme cytochrome c family protein
MKKVLITLLAAALAGLCGAAFVIWRGWYDVSATGGHIRPVYDLLDTALRFSVRRQAGEIAAPKLDDPAMVTRGAGCYRDHCEQCHGGPGVAQSSVGMSLQPLPGPLMDAARRWQPAEIYWITRHGIKMSGMPAWEMRLPERDLWALTAFLQRLPEMTPGAYRDTTEAQAGRCPTANEACAAGNCAAQATADQPTPADTGSRDEAAQLALRQYACVACHRIPGVIGPDTDVGPPLKEWGRHQRIAGRLPNTADDLVRFIRDPRSVDPATAMPTMGVTEAHARLMADYLLKQD